jgi:hypothetical protein
LGEKGKSAVNAFYFAANKLGIIAKLPHDIFVG